MQRDARGFARLRHLHGFLPRQRATRAIVQQIIARSGVGKARNEMVYSEREMLFGGEPAYASEHTSVLRAAYAATDSAPT